MIILSTMTIGKFITLFCVGWVLVDIVTTILYSYNKKTEAYKWSLIEKVMKNNEESEENENET